MLSIILKLHDILNECKNFIPGYSHKNSNKMIIKYQDKFYKVSFEELRPIEITDKIYKKYNQTDKNIVSEDIIQLSELMNNF